MVAEETLGSAVGGGRRLKVLVGIQDEGMNGIETYAEQVALAARSAGHEVTLLVATHNAATAVSDRLGQAGIDIVDLGAPSVSARRRLAERFWTGLQTRRIGAALRAVQKNRLQDHDVVHLNRAALAPFFTGLTERLFVTAWFYPHERFARIVETWHHARGPVLRRGVITAKSLFFYQADERGYRAATAVVACTETLASQLRSKGIRAVACPPPVQVSEADSAENTRVDGPLTLLICCGDLSHPRKNLRDAIRCAGMLARADRPVVIRAIGRNAEALQADVARLPPHAHFEALGPRKPPEVHAEMRRADVFLLPSLYEEWGYVAVEAILSGVPVVTYPVYPFSDMLSGGLGVVATEPRVESLCEAVENAVRSGMRGSRLSEAGLRRFGSLAIGEQLERIWHGNGVLPE